ncbi:uncharacterized protein LOC106072114 isoform X4 [Biomphalaria glabrata]|uniref:Uncharacterized protein LOC106072114 isoform X4 n=1 Tax=Biomphalaria glabrata TaxID=6526 RepID=A0A9W3A5D8_BIOGL|nr:uncharacterized protein LOC106072114 isoform X4 [Biomphalaria glabrata]
MQWKSICFVVLSLDHNIEDVWRMFSLNVKLIRIELSEMDSDYFFYEQSRHKPFQKRFKKLPEDFPDSLKAVNPKVAAYYASKEKQEQDEELFGDGKKTLLPQINQAFNALRNHLDSSLCNDEDSQRYIFEEAKNNAGNILYQLSRIIYYYENIASLIPKSLECQMMVGYSELTADVQVIPREWQTQASKEAYLKKLSEISNGEDEKVSPSVMEEGRTTRSQSIASESGRGNKRLLTKPGAGLPEIYEDGETMSVTGHQNVKRNDSRMSGVSKRSSRPRLSDFRGPSSLASKSPTSKQGFYEFLSALTETASETRSSSLANPPNYVSVLQFQLSSKLCQDKGWIVHKGKEDQLAKEAILEYCVQRLHQELKAIKEQKAKEAYLGHNQDVVVRYYGDTHKETVLKYRKSPVKTSPPVLIKNGKPRIPRLFNENNEGRQIMLSTHPDGTTVVYYTSGRPAIVASAAGINRYGFYTIVYDDDADMKMLAAFTPSGCGVCYHMNGHIRFLSTIKGGHIANKDGRVIRHWKWPQAQVKLTSPVQFQMNQYIGLRCVAENYIVLVFACQKESTRLFVNMTYEARERKHTEHERLLTNITFTSKSAKTILSMTGSRSKSKSKKKKEKLSKQLAELVRSVDNEDKLLYDIEADKDLARLQRKARILVDDWLEHYRITIGLKSPSLEQVRETPRKSRVGAYSAKMTESREDRKNTFGFSLISARVPSAPTATVVRLLETPVDNETKAPVNPPTVRFEQNINSETKNNVDELKSFLPTFNDRVAKIWQSGQRSRSAGQSRSKSSAVSRQSTAVSLPEKEITVANVTLCPMALHTLMLSDLKPMCRCSRHAIPFISDVVYDRYIQEEAPENQLQIIAVVSSAFPESNPSETMLNEIYQHQNRNRTRPCLQCRADSFRILKYDINTAMEGSDHAQPLLLSRHNVVPGMFLIYCEGKLLFCDHIFNGYGNARKDFQKQVLQSRLDFTHGFSLPPDFRFSPSQGPQGPRAPWGGEIGGAGVDHYGSSGTLKSEIVSDNNVGLSQSQANNISSSQLLKLPPIHVYPPLQTNGHFEATNCESVEDKKLHPVAALPTNKLLLTRHSSTALKSVTL